VTKLLNVISDPPTDTGIGDISGASREAALAAWDDYCVKQGLRPATRKAYRWIALRFMGWLDTRSIELGAVTSGTVQDFLSTQDINPVSKSSYRGGLRRFLDALVARGLLPTNPVDDGSRYRRAALTGRHALSVAEEFAALTPIERQAEVHAAAFALAMHDIHWFIQAQSGARSDVEPRANVERCQETLQLGELYGIISFPEDDTAAISAEDDPPAEPTEPAND
jgi:hypothetical protein